MSVHEEGSRGMEVWNRPTAAHESVNASAADVVPTMTDCRYIYADTAGIVKIDYIARDGVTIATETMTLLASTWYPVANVKKVYRYYTGSTAITTTVYVDAGSSLVAGLKLRK